MDSDDRRPLPSRRTQDLRGGRVSVPLARYFITCATAGRRPGLADPRICRGIRGALDRLDRDRDLSLRAATVMPDHLHLLATLGERLVLDRVVAKFKALTREALASSLLGWQANFFEHRLRPDEAEGPFARYLFLNPYRAGLVGRTDAWPYWIPGEGAGWDFLAHLDRGLYPPVEWLTADAAGLGVRGDAVGEEP